MSTGLVPPDWHSIVFSMLPKSVNLTDASNWRPIAILPVLYKVFPRLLYERIHPTLEKEQSDDQFGFRINKRIDDVFSILENVIGKTNEWHLPLWMASIDLRKVFDRILHYPLFDALRVQCVPEGYVQLLAALYSNQQGFVNGIRGFGIQRGVKQGDVISPLLFNAGIEAAFRSWKRLLREHGFLMDPSSTRFTNTRYVDDVMFFAKSMEEATEMVELLIQEFAKFGFELNTSKTKIITNEVVSYEYVDIAGSMVEILGPNSEHRFLGRYLSGDLDNRVYAETQHRTKVAWMKLGQHSKTLCNKNVSIKLRMKLFDSVVSPSSLFGLVVLPLQVSCIGKSNVAQTKMIRKMVGWIRIADEPWENTMRRMGTRVTNAVKQSKMKEWSTRLAETQWKFVARLKTLPITSWQNRAAFWQPDHIDDPACEYLPHRERGGPYIRWDDKVTNFSWRYFGKKWQDVPHLSFLTALPKFVSE